MWTVSRRRRVARTALVASLVFATACAIWATGFARGWRDATTYRPLPHGEVDDRIVVVEFDRPTDSLYPDAPGALVAFALSQLITTVAAGEPSLIVITDAAVTYTWYVADHVQVERAVRDAGNVVYAANNVSVASTRRQAAPLVATYDLPQEGRAAAVAAVGLATDGPAHRYTTPLLYAVPDGLRANGFTITDRDVEGATLVPSVPLAVWMHLEELSTDVDMTDGALTVDGVEVPVESGGELRIRYVPELTGNAGSQMVRAEDVLAGEIETERFAGAIVFIGATDPLVARTFETPGRSERMPAVLVQANATNTLLTAQWLHPPTAPLTLSAVAVFALLVAAVASSTLRGAFFLALVLALGWWIVAAHSTRSGRALELALPLLAIAASFFAFVCLHLRDVVVARRATTRLFAAYVPRPVVRSLLTDTSPDHFRSGQRRHAGLLFTDLRDFTGLTHRLPATEVRSLLDTYYEHVCDEVARHNGTVVQFVGDEVFAVFGALVASPQPSDDALSCALALLRSTDRFAATLAERELPQATFGIGVDAGEVIAAIVGTADRRQFSVIGEPVNRAARLCDAALGSEAVVAASLWADSGWPADLDVAPATIALKGFADPVAVVRVRACESTRSSIESHAY